MIIIITILIIIYPNNSNKYGHLVVLDTSVLHQRSLRDSCKLNMSIVGSSAFRDEELNGDFYLFRYVLLSPLLHTHVSVYLNAL